MLGVRSYKSLPQTWSRFFGSRSLVQWIDPGCLRPGLTSAQFVVVPAASYFMLGEAITLSSILGVVIILLGACPCGAPSAEDHDS